MAKQEFFIGWADGLPAQSKKLMRRLVLGLVLIFGVVAFLLVKYSKPFNDHKFELGDVKGFTGILYTEPFPVLMLDEGQSPISESSAALLVGYGKNGALTFLEPREDEFGSLNGRQVELDGTLIYGDGEVLLELTEKEASLRQVGKRVAIPAPVSLPKEKLVGEILDPKCWFGVMKPAEGKVHKSCAIRCISGGIPPLLRVDGTENDYYFLLGPDGEFINKEILQFVGEEVVTSGPVFAVNGWKYIQIDPTQLEKSSGLLASTSP